MRLGIDLRNKVLGFCAGGLKWPFLKKFLEALNSQTWPAHQKDDMGRTIISRKDGDGNTLRFGKYFTT